MNVPTFFELYLEWLPTYVAEGKEDVTIKKTENHFSLYVLPLWGHMRVTEITPEMCRDMTEYWSEQIAYSNKLRNYVEKVMMLAVLDDWIVFNPFEQIKALPLPTPNKERSLTKWELNRFLNHCRIAADFENFAFFRLVSFTGLKKCEMLALTWADLDFEKQTLNVSKQVVEGFVGNEIAEYKDTEYAKRVILVDTETMAILADYKAKTTYTAEDDYIFSKGPKQHYGLTAPRGWIESILKDTVVGKALGKVTLKRLRDTHEDLLKAARAEPVAVLIRLGLSTTIRSGDKLTVDQKYHDDLMGKVASLIS